MDERGRGGAGTVDVGETPMVVAGDAASPPDRDGPVPAAGAVGWRPSRRAAIGLAATIATVAVVVFVGWPSSSTVAELVGMPARVLPGAPSVQPAQQWALELAPGDEVALVGRLVVVMDSAPGRDTPSTRVIARDVRSRSAVWERRLAEPSLALIVDDQAAATAMYGTGSPVGGVEPQRLVALDADDGDLLWQRPVSFIIGASGGHVLLATDTGCELVETRVGRTTWREETQGCAWLDDDEVMVSRRGGWEVYGLDGTVTRPPVPGIARPAAVGESLVTVDGNDLVLLDRAGDERWRTTTTLDEADGPMWPRHLHGVGVVVTGWDSDTDRQLVEAFDLDGRRLGRDAGHLVNAWVVRADGEPLVVSETFDGDDFVMSIRSVDETDRELAAFVSPHTRATRQGVLASTRSGDRVDLYAWPDLAPAWSVDLSSIVDAHGRWSELLNSEGGVAVVAPAPRTVYVYG